MAFDSPLVSVIIPTYRRASFLDAAVESALEQTVTAVEIIVVEDGSHVAQDVAHRHGPRVSYVWQPHQGASVARNTGAERALGQWLAFLDDDDLWAPEKLERQLALAEAVPEIGLIHTDHYALENGQLRLGPRLTARSAIPSGWVARDLFFDNFVVTSSTIVARRAFVSVGGFDARYRAAQDYELWLRLARYRPFGFVAEPLTIYRVHEERISTNDSVVAPSAVAVLEALVRSTPSVWWDYGRRAVRARLHELQHDCAWTLFYGGRYREAAGHFVRAWRLKPSDVRSLAMAAACGGGPTTVRVLRRLRGPGRPGGR